MNIEQVRKFCLSLSVVAREPERVVESFKCIPEKFAELVERDGIIPAPYVARYHWVALERFDVLPDKEHHELLRKSYDLVFEKLPKKVKKEFSG